MIWLTRGIPYYFQNFDSFHPLFSPKKYTSLVYFLPYYPKDQRHPLIFFRILIDFIPNFFENSTSHPIQAIPYTSKCVNYIPTHFRFQCSQNGQSIIHDAPSPLSVLHMYWDESTGKNRTTALRRIHSGAGTQGVRDQTFRQKRRMSRANMGQNVEKL